MSILFGQRQITWGGKALWLNNIKEKIGLDFINAAVQTLKEIVWLVVCVRHILRISDWFDFTAWQMYADHPFFWKVEFVEILMLLLLLLWVIIHWNFDAGFGTLRCLCASPKGSFTLAVNLLQPMTVAVKIGKFPIICSDPALCDSCCNLRLLWTRLNSLAIPI